MKEHLQSCANVEVRKDTPEREVYKNCRIPRMFDEPKDNDHGSTSDNIPILTDTHK